MIAVLGLGQMGLVCASVLSSADRARGTGEHPIPTVIVWGHDEREAGELSQTRRSPRLPGFALPDEVRVCVKDADLAVADLVVSAIPAQFMRATWERLAGHISSGAAAVSVAKGVENNTLARPSQVIGQVRGSNAPIGVLSGPTIATELARGLPATMVAASESPDLALWVQRLFSTRWLRIYTHSDVLGVELAGATKNVIALAAGILDGLSAGNNAKSALLARGLAEITRLGVAMGAQADTFFGVAGVGDLATSCFSPEGRNRSCGEALGRGERLEDHLKSSRFVVEGVATCRSVIDLARRHQVDMPIASAVHAVLFQGLDPIDALARLMAREPKCERIG